ncbi:MAG: hypothetical protein RLZZ244_1208, partial [Verrucomicrobiota bacterium]
MSLRKLTPGKAIALGLLALAAVALWKIGASSAPVASYTAPAKGKACCDKPMNRAALIRQAAA